MNKYFKWKVLLIIGIVAFSIWKFYPPQEKINLGLDLQGGMHLTLAVDESKGVIQGKSEALDRALKVVRTRIDQFGVSEPVVQKLGTDRIIVELPGIDDERRATDVVQKAAFLQFQITDKTGAFERVIPRLDGSVKEKKLGGVTPDVRGDSAKSPAIKSLFTPKTDSAKTKKAADSTSTTGPFSRLVMSPAGGWAT